MKKKIFGHEFIIERAVLSKGKEGVSVKGKFPIIDKVTIPYDKYGCHDNEISFEMLAARGISELLTWRETSEDAAALSLEIMRKMGFRIIFRNLKNKKIKTISAADTIIVNTAWAGEKFESMEKLDEAIRDILMKKEVLGKVFAA